jgi:GMP synthase (glutamine-hydrolysing)
MSAENPHRDGPGAAPNSDPSPVIVIVKTGEPVASVRERRGHFADLIQGAIGDAWTGRYHVVDVVNEAPPPAVGPAAFVITGSAANVPDRLPWMLRVEAWLREVVAQGTPTFGICFGHQILAQALGGEVQRNPRGREMGTLHIERTAPAPIFDGLPDRFEAHVTHIDSVVRLPPGAENLARSDREAYQAIRFAESCYGVQFHPEMDADVMRAYVETRRDVLTGEGFVVDDMLSRIRDVDAGRRTLQNFVRRFLG